MSDVDGVPVLWAFELELEPVPALAVSDEDVREFAMIWSRSVWSMTVAVLS